MTASDRRFLIDSNILVYSVDPSDAAKQRRSIETFHLLAESSRGVLSVQVLGEFFRASTSRIPQRLDPAEAEARMLDFAEALPVFETSVDAVLEGARGVREHQLSYWDAVIWSTARRHAVPFLLSEDMGNGRVIEGVQILNPLAPSFDMTLLA
jgi:predicted nucleic acid-binding protein